MMSDGERVAPLVAAQDHKRVFDNDQGPNTGGMGAYSTDQIVDDADARMAGDTTLRSPVIAGMKAEGAEYKGILYCGIMMTARGSDGAGVQLPLWRSRDAAHHDAPGERSAGSD